LEHRPSAGLFLRETLPGAVIDYRQDPKAPAIGQLQLFYRERASDGSPARRTQAGAGKAAADRGAGGS
jgi:hypothetical protein